MTLNRNQYLGIVFDVSVCLYFYRLWLHCFSPSIFASIFICVHLHPHAVDENSGTSANHIPDVPPLGVFIGVWSTPSPSLILLPLPSLQHLLFSILALCATLREQLIPQNPPASANYLPARLHPTVNCLHALRSVVMMTGRRRGELQVFLFEFRDSLFFTLMEYSAARRLREPLACLFIQFPWPITGARLCQHLGPASCYYWPHTRMHIQTCNTPHVG